MTGITEQKKSFRKGQAGDKAHGKNHYQPLESDSEIVKMFREYSKELDTKHDKYERIVKHSRDITIASKRIIFSIHALLRSKNIEEDKKKIFESLETVCNTNFKAIAKELETEDSYQFIRAYMWGIQEFVEALTFFQFITEGKFCSFEEVLSYLKFTKDSQEDGDAKEEAISEEKLLLLVPLLDYIMGLQDLTGELMRNCIDSYGANRNGENARDFGRLIYTGLLSLTISVKEFHTKVSIAKQSIEKMEYATYSHHVRGSETPSLPPLVDPLSI